MSWTFCNWVVRPVNRSRKRLCPFEAPDLEKEADGCTQHGVLWGPGEKRVMSAAGELRVLYRAGLGG